MPDFFVPKAISKEEEESVYADLIKSSGTYPLANDGARLYRLKWQDKGHYGETIRTAIVGKEIDGWPEPGEVIAIIDTTQILHIYTESRLGTPINVSPGKVLERVYFDDYPGLL